MKTQQKTLQATLLIALSAVLYGFLGYLGTRVLQENLPLTATLFWRFFIAGTWMLIFVLYKHSKQQIIPINKNTLSKIFFLGAMTYALSTVCYFIASQRIGTGLAMVIFFCYPMIIVLVSWVIHKKSCNRWTLIALLAMGLGLYLLHDPTKTDMSLVGVLFGILSAAFYAGYLIGSKRITEATLDTDWLTMTVCYGSAAFFLIFSLIMHNFMFPPTLKCWMFVLLFGIFATVIPIQLMLKGLQYISSLRASIISVLEPLVTVIVGTILLDETLSGIQILGAGIVLISALIVQFQKEL